MKKMLLVAILLSIPLMLVGNQIAYAGGENPLPGESILGPAMDGIIWLTSSDVPGYLTGVFLGKCKGNPFSIAIDYIPGSLGALTAEQLVNNRIYAAGPPGCRSASGGEDLWITKVKKFDKTDKEALADVDLKFVVFK